MRQIEQVEHRLFGRVKKSPLQNDNGVIGILELVNELQIIEDRSIGNAHHDEVGLIFPEIPVEILHGSPFGLIIAQLDLIMLI